MKKRKTKPFTSVTLSNGERILVTSKEKKRCIHCLKYDKLIFARTDCNSANIWKACVTPLNREESKRAPIFAVRYTNIFLGIKYCKAKNFISNWFALLYSEREIKWTSTRIGYLLFFIVAMWCRNSFKIEYVYEQNNTSKE